MASAAGSKGGIECHEFKQLLKRKRAQEKSNVSSCDGRSGEESSLQGQNASMAKNEI